jgi:signal transduction histidine kinase
LLPVAEQMPHPAFVRHVERELAGVIGSSSAAAMVQAVLEGRQFAFEDVVTLFDDTREAIQFSRKILFSTLENLSQGVSVVDRDLQLVAWNKRYLEMFDYPVGMVRVGRSVADIVRFNAERGLCGPGNADEHVAKRIQHMKNGTAHVFQRVRPDGSVIEIRGNPIPGGGFVTSFTDVTDHVTAVQALAAAKQHLEQRVLERTAQISQMNSELLAEIDLRRATESQLLHATAAAEAANASKTRFLALASHDILQPLNAARLFAAALQPQVTPAGQRMLQQLENSLKATEDLMATLLDIARLDEGKLDIRSGPVDLSALLQPLIDEMHLLASQKQLQLRARIGQFVVHSHATYLRRIVQNILSNAVKYTQQGKVLISCRQRGQQLWLEVRDTGPGMSEPELSMIFNDFYRVSQTAKGQSGVGLGLGVVQRMARALGHEIAVYSLPGRGSCFRLFLPLTAAIAVKDPAEKMSLAPASAQQLKVLCIDDDQTNLLALAALLAQWQLGEIRVEHDIQQLEQLDYQPDLLIVDYQLGEAKDGIMVFTGLKQRSPDLHGILVTAAVESDLPQRAKEAGMILLAKPIKPAALRATLKSLKLQAR